MSAQNIYTFDRNQLYPHEFMSHFLLQLESTSEQLNRAPGIHWDKVDFYQKCEDILYNVNV